MLSREKRIVIEIAGKENSIQDSPKVEFYNKAGVYCIEITNESVKSPSAVKAIGQALALSVESSHPERIWNYEKSS